MDERQPVVIRNRDIIALHRVIPVMQIVRSLESQCIWERGRMQSITQHITGMPRGGGVPTGLDAAFAMLDEIETEQKERIKEYVRELRTAERIINAIPNENMRAFVILLYLHDLTPEEVRRELNMSKWGFRRARRAVEQARDFESVRWRDRYILQKDDEKTEENGALFEKPS